MLGGRLSIIQEEMAIISSWNIHLSGCYTKYKNLTSFAGNNNVYVSRSIKNLEKYNTFE